MRVFFLMGLTLTSNGTSVLLDISTQAFYASGAKIGSKYFLTEQINLDLNVNNSANLSSIV